MDDLVWVIMCMGNIGFNPGRARYYGTAPISEWWWYINPSSSSIDMIFLTFFYDIPLFGTYNNNLLN